MTDYCIRATAAKGQVRCWAAMTTALCEEARKRHDTYPVATAALGRLLTAGVMMGLNLKGEDTLTLRVEGDGPIGSIIVAADAAGKVRGYVQNPHIHVPGKVPGKLNVGGAVGIKGFLYIVKDLGLKDTYTGTVSLVNGEIGEEITRYFTESEQIPSAVALGVLVETDNSVRASGGYIVQLMPGASEETILQLEKNISKAPPVSQMVDEGLLPEEIAEKILEYLDPQVLEQVPVKFQCQCTRERLVRVLKAIGLAELESLLKEEGQAEITCSFCGEKYLFSAEDLQEIINEAKNGK
jgi:molecular chaperone Hsp33